ncbi:MAG: Fatty acid desaturase [Chloroflexi bacterium]|nr:MAG: Fatty acid desaturase [Chloroflexota bacterium]
MREVRKALRVKWYRTPIEKQRLWHIMERSDRKGFTQTLGHIGLATGLGAAVSYFFIVEQWALFGLFLWLFGTVRTFLSGPANHELGHGAVFRTPALNRFFLRILSVLTFWNYNEYRMSHTYHHRYTLHPDADREEFLPRNPSLHPLVIAEMLTINVRGMIRTLRFTVRTALGRFDSTMVAGAMGSSSWIETLADIHPQTYRAAIRLARITLLFHAAVIALAIAFELWWLAIVITGANFVGNWYRYALAQTQHAGLRDNVPDFRLCVRSLLVDPITAFLYWHMDAHLEHHMFAGVPCYHMAALRREIDWDTPAPRSVVGAWREMYLARRLQKTDPNYQFDTPLPSTANPGVVTDAQLPDVPQGAGALAASIGALDPDDDNEQAGA